MVGRNAGERGVPLAVAPAVPSSVHVGVRKAVECFFFLAMISMPLIPELWKHYHCLDRWCCRSWHTRARSSGQMVQDKV